MTTRPLRALLAALPLCALSAALLVLPGAAVAQQPWPGEQAEPTPPAPPARRSVRRARPAARATATVSGRPALRGAAQRTIACSGVFGRDSTHLKLAMAFESRNIVFTQVDGDEGGKLNASVVFPNDPKRRLEVLWQNEATRSDTALIVIGGQSQWIAPKGLHLGMPLAALEKANGKPFKLKGLDQDNGGSVLDWDGGAMDSLPGGCKVGVRLAPDSKAAEAARAAVVGKELMSNDAALKPAKLGVAEIILGY